MELGYGKLKLDFIAGDGLKKVLTPNVVETALRGEAAVVSALNAPIGTPKLGEIVKPTDKVVIVTSDITRPLPSRKVLPPVIAELNAAGVPDENITVVFALGSHRKHTDDEKKYMVGEKLFARLRCIDSDPNDVKSLGKTAHGTPIDIFTPVAEADIRICLGNIEYHYFAGYSGGAKAIMPGVSTPAAIQINHKLMTEPDAVAGNPDSPVRRDIEEVIESVGIDFIVNVVLDEHKKIIFAVAGHYIEAHRAGCRFLDSMYKIPLKQKADIVVVSAGGYPKDLNMYQAQKALDNAKHAVRDGGIIIWLAACSEGFGSAKFEYWMKNVKPADMATEIRKNFVLGGHKAAAIGMVLQHARIFLVSEMDEATVRAINLEPFSYLETAYAEARRIIGDNAEVYVMPYGGSTLPVIE